MLPFTIGKARSTNSIHCVWFACWLFGLDAPFRRSILSYFIRCVFVLILLLLLPHLFLLRLASHVQFSRCSYCEAKFPLSFYLCSELRNVVFGFVLLFLILCVLVSPFWFIHSFNWLQSRSNLVKLKELLRVISQLWPPTHKKSKYSIRSSEPSPKWQLSKMVRASRFYSQPNAKPFQNKNTKLR